MLFTSLYSHCVIPTCFCPQTAIFRVYVRYIFHSQINKMCTKCKIQFIEQCVLCYAVVYTNWWYLCTEMSNIGASLFVLETAVRLGVLCCVLLCCFVLCSVALYVVLCVVLRCVVCCVLLRCMLCCVLRCIWCSVACCVLFCCVALCFMLCCVVFPYQLPILCRSKLYYILSCTFWFVSVLWDQMLSRIHILVFHSSTCTTMPAI